MSNDSKHKCGDGITCTGCENCINHQEAPNSVKVVFEKHLPMYPYFEGSIIPKENGFKVWREIASEIV